MARSPSRRDFLRGTSAVGLGALSVGVWSQTSRASRQANDKLQLAAIGTANRAAADINGLQGEDFIAICDIDDNYLNRAGSKFPDAEKFNDYRELIDEMAEKLDGVMVGTADHSHAPASALAIRAGLHCYCEKPLTHTVAESRKIAELTAEYDVVTQLGTQIHAGENYRKVVEIIQSGAIGPVHEVHVWVGKAWGGGDRPEGSQEPPANLHWDLWLGAAPERPYWSGRYHPAQWRRWWDFGTGTLGDMGCHYMDLPFWALDLKYPNHVEAEGPEAHPETGPLGLKVKYQFPARGDHPATELTWYDGNMAIREAHGERVPGSGVMFVGSEGHMFADYGSYRLFPAEKYSDFEPPAPTIPRSIGHHAEWIAACKGELELETTTCNFGYSGPLSETVLLGNVAHRAGQAFDWDAENLIAVDCPAAQQYVSKEYREGWDLVLV